MGFTEMGVAGLDGKIINNDGSTADISDREYFKKAMQGQSVVTGTLISQRTNSAIFAYTAPIYHHKTEKVIGVINGIVDGALFSELVGSIEYGDTGYSFAIDSTGKTIAHKDVDKVLSEENPMQLAESNPELAPVAGIHAKMAAGEEGIGDHSYKGEKR